MGGSGSSPRALPRFTGIWRPALVVDCCWLPVPRRCIVLHGPADRVRPYSGADRPSFNFRGRFVERGFSARLARPSVDGLPPDKAGVGLRSPFPGRFPQGSARATGLVASPWSPRYGSCLFALKLRFLRRRATPFSAPPAFGFYCPGHLFPPAGGPWFGWTHSAMNGSPCVLRLRSRGLWTAFRWSDTVRNYPPH
jgi:hypothetical protein